MKTIDSIVVVGGGTAGWLTAGRLAVEQRQRRPDRPVRVTLVESPNTPIVGVGEGTWPTMRATLKRLGIRETDFIRECDATFKQGAKFAKWSENRDADFYYHPLMIPQGFPKTDLATHWLSHERSDSFSKAVCFQEQLCESGIAPKMISTPEYSSVANYAYHLDAGKFAQYLQKHCTETLGVTHVLADVEAVLNDDDGDIRALVTTQVGELEGDLFVDCTGFSALLIGKHYDVPFNDCSSVLQIDRALASHVAYPEPDSPIPCHTISTGQSAGWIWDIGLRHRRGVGYVYSSDYISDDQAERELRDYIGEHEIINQPRRIDIKSGYRDYFWHRNCVAVGLSAGFLEPLEASAIVLVELSANMIAEQLPATRSAMNIVAKRFNTTFQYRWQRIVDFLKLHYLLTKRDEPFWRSMSDPNSVSESLAEQLELWRYQVPCNHDFESNNEVFPAASYQYVLYGMGFEIDGQNHRRSMLSRTQAEQEYQRNVQITQQALSKLPSHRELINKIHDYGMQAI
jgi:flavin-dependent dehydrogenase